MAANSFLADDIAAALFALPCDRLCEALGRLPVGFLWHSCLPGMDPAMALHTLGAQAEDALRQAACAWAGGDGTLLAVNAGLPFSVDTRGDLSPLGAALLNDACALVAQSPAFGAVALPGDAPPWTVEIVHRPRAEWTRRVLACLDFAAAESFAGRLPDTVLGLLRSPDCDLTGFVPMADADTRLRFIEAVDGASGADNPLDRFRRSHWRRGAAAGLLAAIRATLTSVTGAGITGLGADGWPTWWQAVGPDPTVVLAAVPQPVLADALDVRSSLLPGDR